MISTPKKETCAPIDSVSGELNFLFRDTDDNLIPPLNAKSWEMSLLDCKQSQCFLSKRLLTPLLRSIPLSVVRMTWVILFLMLRPSINLCPS